MLYRESLETERALIEERYENKISNLQKHLKKFYSQELKVRALSSVLNLHNFLGVLNFKLFFRLISFRREIRRLKLCLLPLTKGRKLNRPPCWCHRKTLRGLAVLCAS